jgi:hypothetical protein
LKREARIPKISLNISVIRMRAYAVRLRRLHRIEFSVHTGGCDADFAQKLGAELSITGTVQKVSNLILNINLYARVVATRAPLVAMSVDIRGNTDESWSRGLEYLVRTRFLPPENRDPQ